MTLLLAPLFVSVVKCVPRRIATCEVCKQEHNVNKCLGSIIYLAD